MRDPRAVPDRRLPAQSRGILVSMGRQLHAALDVMVVPLPGGEVQPGRTWTESKAMPLGFGEILLPQGPVTGVPGL